MQKFYGSMPALITPFHDNGSINEQQFTQFVEWQIEQGSHGLVPVGTTGESPTLSHEEHLRVIELTIKTTRGRVPVIAGAGSNSTDEAIYLAKSAQKLGADALLVVMPYYNKPSPEGQYLHFKAINDAVTTPIIIYNIPGRSVVDMSVATMARIYNDCKNVIGVKDATNDLPRCTDQKLALGDKFILLSGEDASSAGFYAMGGHGIISVVANVAPKLNAQMATAWHNGDIENFQRIRDLLFPLGKALFCENSPAPTKYALSLLGKCSTKVRLPLAVLSANGQKTVEQAMRHAQII